MDLPFPLLPITFSSISQKNYDALIVVSTDFQNESFPGKTVVEAALRLDKKATSNVSFLVSSEVPGERLIFSPTGPLNRDYDDVRGVGDATRAGLLRAIQAGSTKPLIFFSNIKLKERFPRAIEVGLLGALAGVYQPLQAREANVRETLESLTFTVSDLDEVSLKEIATIVKAIETGRRLARDLGGADPERMTPLKFAEHVVETFKTVPNTKITVFKDPEELKKSHPLLSAVARCSLSVPRHHPCVIRLEYTPPGEQVNATLLFSGKGVTYDTGGADVKAGGIMAGMSRDKCGAANIAGFILTASQLPGKNTRIVAELGLVRNSIGSDAYVSDEVITSHAGVRVKVGNTDAEGRMVLADCLSHMRVEALKSVNPRLMTCATLTGHAVRCVGPYSIALDNGPARYIGISKSLAEVGERWGDPIEISMLRRDDYKMVSPKSTDHDVLQCNTLASSATQRGHQFPAAFILIASGLDKHGIDSSEPLCFTHLDIAGSMVEESPHIQFGNPTASPIVPLTARFLLENIK